MGITFTKRPGLIFKVAVLAVWLLLFGLLLKRDMFLGTIDSREALVLAQAERETFAGIYFREKKIGFVENIYQSNKDGTSTVLQRAQMTLNVAGIINPVSLHLRALLNQEGKLSTFDFSFQSPLYKMQADGRVEGSTVIFNLATGSTVIHDRVKLSSQPMLSMSRRSYLLHNDLQPGQKFRIPLFDPVSLTGQDATVEYRGRERIIIHGRVQNLHHFIESLAGARVNSWLDDKGDVMKEESPAGFVFLREPKFKALKGYDETPELLSAVSARLIGTMPALDGLRRINYRLQFPDDGSFQLDAGRQHYADGLLTIDLEPLPETATSGGPPCTAGPDDLAATASVQSDSPKILGLAGEILAGEKDGLARVRALAGYVYTHLEKRPVLGLPDALTVLDSGKGDCNEHAVLFAALARAAGIPCRIAAGVVYFREAFYYHAWNEVCVGGQWLSIDTTMGQIPADLSHIRFVLGGIREQMQIGALLGQLTIEPLPDQVPPQEQRTKQPVRQRPAGP